MLIQQSVEKPQTFRQLLSDSPEEKGEEEQQHMRNAKDRPVVNEHGHTGVVDEAHQSVALRRTRGGAAGLLEK